MFKSSLVLSLVVGGVLASESVSRIVVPLPKLMKYSEAAKACEAEGMKLTRFTPEENIDYATATMVENNLDRVWIGGMGEDERKQLALEVFEGQPIVFKVEQILDEEKMLAVLCEPSFSPVKPLEESIQNLNIKEEEKVSEVVICKFEVNQEEKSVQVISEEDNGIDLIKCKGRRSRCGRSARSRRSSICSKSCSSSSSSSSECERRPHRRNHYRYERHGGYRRNRRSHSKCSSSSSSTCSSTSSSSCTSSSENCSDNFSCSPYDPTGSSSSSSSESKCRKPRRSCRKPKRHHSKSHHSKSDKKSSSSSTSSSSSSSEECGTGLCHRSSKRFFREIRLTQRIH